MMSSLKVISYFSKSISVKILCEVADGLIETARIPERILIGYLIKE